MDVLTDLLQGLRSRNQIYGLLELGAPWGIEIASRDRLSFYAVSRGTAVLSCKEDSLQLVAGDIVLVRRGVAHMLADRLETPTIPVAEVLAQRGGICGGIVPYGGRGQLTTIVAGGFTFDTTVLEPLIANLPPLLHVRSDGVEAANLLASTLQFMASEMHAEAPGYEMVASRLADVLFVHALRIHVRDNPGLSGQWLQAIGDPKLGLAFQRMHEHPDQPWTIDSLANIAAMSRSAFAARFTRLLGISPLAYLTRWRMHRAAEMLAVDGDNISEIGMRVGYETESAFIKVFKRHFGETPATYRRRLNPPQRGRSMTGYTTATPL